MSRFLCDIPLISYEGVFFHTTDNQFLSCACQPAARFSHGWADSWFSVKKPVSQFISPQDASFFFNDCYWGQNGSLENKPVLRTAVTLCLVVKWTLPSGCLATVRIHAVHNCGRTAVAWSIIAVRGAEQLILLMWAASGGFLALPQRSPALVFWQFTLLLNVILPLHVMAKPPFSPLYLTAVHSTYVQGYFSVSVTHEAHFLWL